MKNCKMSEKSWENFKTEDKWQQWSAGKFVSHTFLLMPFCPHMKTIHGNRICARISTQFNMT